MKNMKEIGLSKYSVSPKGYVYSLRTNRILMGGFDGGGYKFVVLTDDLGNVVNRKVHRLVAQFYVSGYSNGLQVNHKNGVKHDNNSSNLEWVTPSVNTQHANDTGLRKQTFIHEGSSVPEDCEIIHDWTKTVSHADMTEEDVIVSCKLLEDGYRVCDVSRMTGYNRRWVQYLRDNKLEKWSMIVSQYNFDRIKRKVKTSPDKVIEVCELLQDGRTITEVAESTGLCRKTVSTIKSRKFHKDLSSGYKF